MWAFIKKTVDYKQAGIKWTSSIKDMENFVSKNMPSRVGQSEE